MFLNNLAEKNLKIQAKQARGVLQSLGFRIGWELLYVRSAKEQNE